MTKTNHSLNIVTTFFHYYYGYYR